MPLPDGNILGSSLGSGVAHLSGTGSLLQQIADPTYPNRDFTGIQRDSNGHLWIGGYYALYRVEGQSGWLSLQPDDLPGTDRAHVTDLELDSNGRLWAGYKIGLAHRDFHGSWQQITTNQRIEEVQSFTFGGSGAGDEIWISYQAGKRFARLLRRGVLKRFRDGREIHLRRP